jgi:MFS family permease
MAEQKKTLLLINLLGGSAVLGSYIWGALAHPGAASLLRGGIPAWAVPFYIASMALAAIGYLLFTGYLLFVLDPARVKINIRAGFKGFHVLYLLILVPSALWMPLTYAMLANPSNLLWLAIRFALMLVGLGGLGMLSALLSIQPRSRLLLAAFIGGIFFCIQTVLLDALVWPNFFRLP